MIKVDNPNAKILIVDDTPANISILFETLSKYGYKVFVANNGEEALNRVEIIEPDLILLDVMMPGLDGFQVCKQLKETTYTRDIPVIFMTALDDADTKVKGFDYGAVDYITKPFRFQEVLSRINHHISFERMKQELRQNNKRLEAKVKERTKELQFAKEKAEASDKLKTEFLAIMSHEIRTPINAILSFSSLLKIQLNVNLTDDLETSLHIIESGGRRLVRTFDLIMNYSRVQTETHDFTPEEFDLYDTILVNLVSKYFSKAKNKGLDFDVDMQTEDCSIIGDPQMVEAIFDNLIDNAITFTAKGKITITILRNHTGQLTVSVTDTGIGISEEFTPSLFAPFAQEDQSFSRSYEGVGLGLALTKRYIELHNWQITVVSKKNKGTGFTITIN